MITKSNIGSILIAEPFNFQEIRGIYTRHYGTSDEGFDLSYNLKAGTFDYPDGVEADRSTTQDNHQKESFVVFLCVAQLFSIGYQPKHIKLEGRNYSGTDKGYCDILVKNNDGEEYLIIECKTAEFTKKDDEFRKHWAKTMRNGDQLFRYFNTYRKAKYLCMLAADFPEYKKEDGTKGNKFEFIYHLISLVDNDDYLKTDESLRSFRSLREEQGGSEDFFKVWKQTYKQDYSTRGLLEKGIESFNIGKKSYNLNDLDTINEYSLNKKYNEFAVILRKHTISSHENAFDKLVNLFLSKIIDERYHGKELTFLWKGAAYDDYFSLQDRLNILYRKGMKEFFGDEVTYVENEQIDAAFAFLTSKADEGKDTIKRYFRQLKYFNNNPFAFLDVHNEQLFFQNSSVLKDVISMLQGIYLTKQTDNQFLGDLFEGFLNKGIHQSEGQFFSPIPIVRFLISSLPLNKIIEQRKAIPRVIDYACGSGHFLTEYARQIQKIVDKDEVEQYYKQIIGIEKDYRLSKVSQVAAFMYGMDGIRIHFSDALVEIPEVKKHSFDILVANPPYSVSGFLETLTEEERTRYTLTQYVSNPEKNNSIETFFIERASQLLVSGGIASIILPSSILSKGNLYMKTRELLLRDFDIIAICCFGKNTFGQTNTSTVALFLRRKAVEPNYAKHLQNRIDAWFNGNMDDDVFYKDSLLLDAYFERVGFLRDDYIAMMRGELTNSFLQTEMVQDYLKALNIPKVGNNTAATALVVGARKVREEAQKYVISRSYKELTSEGKKDVIESFRLKFIQEVEKEKLYYFLLSASNPQPVLVVTSPENKGKKDRKEQEFLGYEWSNRKGAEGIHYLNTGTVIESLQDDEDADDDTISQLLSVDDICTPLFNPKDLFDNLKINTLIRKNFCCNESFEIPESLANFVHQYDLTDMLNFDGVEFDKVISTNIAFKVKFESKYDIVSLNKVVNINPSKKEISKLPLDTFVSFIEMASISEHGYINKKEDRQYSEVKTGGYTYFAENDIIIAKITPCMENGKCAIATGLTNKIAFGSSEFHVFRCSNEILNTYLFALLNTPTVRFVAQKNMTGSSGHRRVPENFYSTLEIPLPPLSIQQKIAEECAKVNEDLKQSKETIKLLEAEMDEILQKSLSGELENVKLSDICNMQSGKFVPADKIVGNPTELYKYPCFGGNGMRGYTTTMTNEGDYILIGRQGALCGNVCMAHGKFHATEHAIVVYPNSNVDNLWLKYFLANMNLNQYSTGRAQPGLSVQRILSIRISIPKSLNLQRTSAERIMECEQKINALKLNIGSCPTRRQEILDKYLK